MSIPTTTIYLMGFAHGVLLGCGVFIWFVCGFFDGVVAVLAPEGAAIHSVLSK